MQCYMLPNLQQNDKEKFFYLFLLYIFFNIFLGVFVVVILTKEQNIIIAF